MKVYNFSGIMRVVRKELGYNQKEMAALLNITQGTISKIENNLLHPTAIQWTEFCTLAEIPMDSYKYFHVDKISLKNTDNKKKSLLTLPAVYRDNANIRVRFLIPVFEYFKTELGEKSFTKYFKSLGIDPDYVMVRDKKFNYKFFIDLFEYLSRHTDLTSEKIKAISKGIFTPSVHGQLLDSYNQATSPIEKVERFISKLSKYQTFSTIDIETKNATSIELKEIFCDDINYYGPQYSNLTNDLPTIYTREFFTQIAKGNSNQEVTHQFDFNKEAKVCKHTLKIA